MSWYRRAAQGVVQLHLVPDILNLGEVGVMGPKDLAHLIDEIVRQVLAYHQIGDDPEGLQIGLDTLIDTCRHSAVYKARIGTQA